MRIIILLTLFLVTAVTNALEPPESYVAEPHLRGANEERDLYTGSGSSKTIAFSFASAVAGDSDACLEISDWCFTHGKMKIDSDAWATAVGSAGAVATSDLEVLFADALCFELAAAWSQVCAFSQASGKIKVETRVENKKQNIYLSLVLNAATKTFAWATSTAVAGTYAGVGAKAYTDVTAYCSSVGNMSPLCASGTASTDLETIAIAAAGSMGQSFSLADSGSSSGSSAQVWARGTVLEYAAGIVEAYATSWAFADAGAAAIAFAKAISDVSVESFTKVCIKKYATWCGGQPLPGFCGLGADSACAVAWSAGEIYVYAIALACAEAYVTSSAYAHTQMKLQANLDCTTTPKLAWTCASAAADTTCVV
jgi:hypothetical protein